jgi:hypothetical protein
MKGQLDIDSYYSEPPADTWPRLVWKSVIERALLDWRLLENEYNLLIHRELFRFIFFESEFITLSSICRNILDSDKLLIKARNFAKNTQKKHLLRLSVSNIDNKICESCKVERPYYDMWSFFEAANINVPNSDRVRAGKRTKYCFRCISPSNNTLKGKKLYGGTQIHILEREMTDFGKYYVFTNGKTMPVVL